MRLEAGEHLTNLIGGSKIHKSIGNIVLAFQRPRRTRLAAFAAAGAVIGAM